MGEERAILGVNCQIQDNVILGERSTRVKTFKKLKIGDNALVRSFSIIFSNTIIGNNFTSGFRSLIRENNNMGDNVSIGSNTELGHGNLIGSNVRIHSSCFLEHTIIKNNVIIGPHVVFTNDLHPSCPKYEECELWGTVEENVSIGANSTILPGIKIGKNSLIGAGTVVTKDVPKNSVVVGNPGKVIKKIDELVCHKKFFKKPFEWREKWKFLL